MLLSVSADRQICEGFSKKDALKTQSDWNIPVTVQEKKKKKRPERKAVSAHLHSLLDSEWTVLSPLLLLLREPQP